MTTPPGKWPVKWPIVAPITSPHPRPVLEEWTLAVQRDREHDSLFHFDLSGSVTGADGAGRSDTRFVSNSGRVGIEAEDWNAQYALTLAGMNPVPDSLEVCWRVEPHFIDSFTLDADEPLATSGAANLAERRLAHGLKNGKHTLLLQ